MTHKITVSNESQLKLWESLPWARQTLGRLVLAGALLSPTAATAEVQPVVPAEEALLNQDFSEDSVLIATRKVNDPGAAEAEPTESTLEPISTHSDREPKLADPPPADKLTEQAPAAEPAAEPAAVAFATDATTASVTPNTDEVEPGVEEQAEPLEQQEEAPRVASRSTVSADPADVGKDYAHKLKVEPARFHGVVPGVSTREELVEAWGEAKEVIQNDAGQTLQYDMPPFAMVDVMIESGVVDLIKVELDAQQQPERLARRLRLDKIKPVEILDEAGDAALGVAYPEKGMLFVLAQPSESSPPNTPQFVTHMVISPLDAEAFALRADQAPYGAFTDKMADLEQAIKIDPTNAYANWRLAQLHLLTASPEKATPAAEAAVDGDPNSDAYLLCQARCLTEQGNYDEAVLVSRKILDSSDAPAVIKAGALHLMGRLASLGESQIAEKAVGFQTMSIDIADKLATSNDDNERRTAKRLLVDAHLAVAREISRRKYANKTEIVAQWIGRASGLAEEMISSDAGSLELRLVVAREALATLANLKPTKDPAPWIREAEEAASQLLAASTDDLFRSRVEWQLGEAYFHALRVEHTRKQADSGIRFGKQAIKHLSASAVVGDIRPSAESLVGRLYFHIGAVYAVHKQDHAEALSWYKEAYPLLTSQAPESKFVAPRRKGEALVSMAVSHWEQDERQQAVDLTVAGSELMEQAVAAGVLDETALAVPYGNLATMHKRLGDLNKSTEFARLARGARGSVPEKKVIEQAAKPKPTKQPSRSASKSTGRTNSSAKKTSTPSQPTKRTASRPTTSTTKSSGQSSTGKSPSGRSLSGKKVTGKKSSEKESNKSDSQTLFGRARTLLR